MVCVSNVFDWVNMFVLIAGSRVIRSAASDVFPLLHLQYISFCEFICSESFSVSSVAFYRSKTVTLALVVCQTLI